MKKKNSSWVEWSKGFKKKKLTETLELTLNMYKRGDSIETIAKKRIFKVESVERHIVELISKSFLDVKDVVKEKQVNLIKEAINKVGEESLSNIMQECEEKVTWFEIKCVLAQIAAKPERI